jgi:hypothetical protein
VPPRKTSIGVSTFRDLATRLRPSGTLFAVNAWSGRPTAPAVDILSQWVIAYGIPRQVLMAVGSNDIVNPSGFSEQIARVMTMTGPKVIVYWPEIHVSRWHQSVGLQVADEDHQLVHAPRCTTRQSDWRLPIRWCARHSGRDGHAELFDRLTRPAAAAEPVAQVEAESGQLTSSP